MKGKKELTIREAGALGGKARAKKLTAKQRSEIARKGGQTRWAKKRGDREGGK
jgi:hypothetical protein